MLLLAAMMVVISVPAQSQTRQSAPDDALFRTLASLDNQLFDAYNRCDLEGFAAFFEESVEFYHDKGGVTLGRAALVDSVRTNICGKVRRDPFHGTLEVHPMDGYGALQIGSHRFCDSKSQHCDGVEGGVGKFIHLWHQSGSTWRITRVISYEHAPVAK